MLPVERLHRRPGPGEPAMPFRQLGLATLAGDPLLGLGADRRQPGVVRADPQASQLPSDMPRRPRCLGLIGPAHVQQRTVRQSTQVHAVSWAEYGERGVPGCAFLRAVTRWLGSDRLAWVVVAVHLPVSPDLGGPALPVQPVQRIAR